MAEGTTYINIDDSDGDYFYTRSQVEKSRRRQFVDTSRGSQLSGSNTAVELLSRPPNRSPVSDSRSQVYLSSGTLDIRRYGTEITDIKHWSAGTIKISAGTPGHIVQPVCFGADNVSIIDVDIFHETPRFVPKDFILAQLGDFDAFLATYGFPIITSDRNLLDNYNYNGIVEPLSIRPVISFSSVEAPYESHDIRATFMGGNETRASSDAILTVDQYEPGRVNRRYFLDAGDGVFGLSGSVSRGANIPYFNLQENSIAPWDDSVRPRGVTPSSTYDVDMIAALTALSQSTSFYISEKERSASTGFMYDNTNPQGTDSIAFGGMLY